MRVIDQSEASSRSQDADGCDCGDGDDGAGRRLAEVAQTTGELLSYPKPNGH